MYNCTLYSVCRAVVAADRQLYIIAIVVKLHSPAKRDVLRLPSCSCSRTRHVTFVTPSALPVTLGSLTTVLLC